MATEAHNKAITDLLPDTLIELFEIEMGDGRGLKRFHPGKIIDRNIVLGGNVYPSLPIEATGFESRGDGSLPRPKLIIANPDGLISDLIKREDDMVGHHFKRIRIFLKFLDEVNFPEMVNPFGNSDPESRFDDDVYVFNRKVSENKYFIEFELVSPLEVENYKLPARIMIANYCPWKYRGIGCRYGSRGDYTGPTTNLTAQDGVNKLQSVDFFPQARSELITVTKIGGATSDGGAFDGATSMAVDALPVALRSGNQLNFKEKGAVFTLGANAAVGAITISGTLVGDVDNDNVGTLSYPVGNYSASLGLAETVTNGTFATDSDWTKGTGWSIDTAGGKAVAAAVGESILFSQSPTQSAVALVIGKKYRLTYTISDYTSGTIRAKFGSDQYLTIRSGNDTYTEDVFCTSFSASGSVQLAFSPVATFSGSISAVSVIQLTFGIAIEELPLNLNFGQTVRFANGGRLTLDAGANPNDTEIFGDLTMAAVEAAEGGRVVLASDPRIQGVPVADEKDKRFDDPNSGFNLKGMRWVYEYNPTLFSVALNAVTAAAPAVVLSVDNIPQNVNPQRTITLSDSGGSKIGIFHVTALALKTVTVELTAPSTATSITAKPVYTPLKQGEKITFSASQSVLLTKDVNSGDQLLEGTLTGSTIASGSSGTVRTQITGDLILDTGSSAPATATGIVGYVKGDVVSITSLDDDPPVLFVCIKDHTSVQDPRFKKEYWVEDQCSKTLNGCKMRFSEYYHLPFGGFPSIEAYRYTN
jgi:lambda family phage minor tail protein L